MACQGSVKVYNTDTAQIVASFSSGNSISELCIYFIKLDFRCHGDEFGLFRKWTTPLCRTGIWHHSGVQLVVKGSAVCPGNAKGEHHFINIYIILHRFYYLLIQSAISCMEFTPDGSILAVGTSDGSIELWKS